MLSLFTVVLSPDTPMWQMGVYGVWMALMLFVWLGLVALMLSAPAVSKRFQRFGHWIDRFCGGRWLCWGLRLSADSLGCRANRMILIRKWRQYQVV